MLDCLCKRFKTLVSKTVHVSVWWQNEGNAFKMYLEIKSEILLAERRMQEETEKKDK